jgi:hypothetical protein
MSKIKPDIGILIEELEDDKLKEIFRRVVNFHETQNQLQDFIHVEVCHTKAATGQKVAHNLGYVPKDISPLKLVGPGIVTFNYCKFDSKNLDYDVTGKVRGRFFVGSNVSDQSRVPDEVADVQEFKAGSGISFKTVTDSIVLTDSDYAVLGNGSSVTITLPSVAASGGKEVVLKNINSAELTIKGADTENIDGANTAVLNENDSITVVSDGSEWRII